VKVAVADVANHAGQEAGLADVVFGLLDDVGQAAHGDGLFG
jgi:hypothetical protein